MDPLQKIIKRQECALETAQTILTILTSEARPFAEFLRAQRARKGMTQKDFAKYIGAKTSYYIKCENGERGPIDPDYVSFFEMSEKLGASVKEIDSLYRRELNAKRNKMPYALRQNLLSLLAVIKEGLSG